MPDFACQIERGLERHPFEQGPDEPLVGLLADRIGRVTGSPAATGFMAAWTDSALIRAAGIPCVLFGPDGAGAHAATEWADRDSVLQVTDILTATIADVCH